MQSKTQTRGNCQMCGRDQAIKRGTMAHHGYTVEHGFFNGACSGHNYEPLQIKRDMADKVISDVRAQCDELDGRADAYESMARDPAGLFYPGACHKRDEKPSVAFKDLNEWRQKEERRSAVWNARSRAKSWRQFCDYLQKLADTVHGQPLREVTKAEAAAPIHSGEKRQGKRVLMTARYQQGARVYFSYTSESGKTASAWLGTRAWRALPIVE